MRAIIIRVSHDHQTSVSKLRNIGVFLALLETEDLLQVIEFLVPCQLRHRGIANVFTFPPERKDPVVISSHHRKTGDSEGLC